MNAADYQSVAAEIDREAIRNDDRSELRRLDNCHGEHSCDSQICVLCLGKEKALENLRKLAREDVEEAPESLANAAANYDDTNANGR